MNKKYLAFEHICRWWLTGILLFLPFQFALIRSPALSSSSVQLLLRWIDELTILFIFPVAIILFVREKKCNNTHLLLLVPLTIFCLVGILSGLVNGNSVLITVWGTVTYVQFFLPLFIYAWFFRNFDHTRKLVQLLLLLGAFLGVVALIQEVWALMSVHFFGKEMADDSIYLWRKFSLSSETVLDYDVWWRAGLYRTSSLMGHYNNYGIYSLLLLTLYLFMEKRISVVLFLILFTGVVVSVSRSVYLGFAIISGLQILWGRRWMAIFLVPALFMLIHMSDLPDLNISREKGVAERGEYELSANGEDARIQDITYFRNVGRQKALEVWRDHPVWGAGPGMFGSQLAVRTNSYVHDEYDFSTHIMKSIAGSLDQFWPQLLVETGIAGMVTYSAFIIFLIVLMNYLRQNSTSFKNRGLLSGLVLFIVVLIIWGAGANILMVEIIFTYSALAGMAIGSRESDITDSRQESV